MDYTKDTRLEALRRQLAVGTGGYLLIRLALVGRFAEGGALSPPIYLLLLTLLGGWLLALNRREGTVTPLLLLVCWWAAVYQAVYDSYPAAVAAYLGLVLPLTAMLLARLELGGILHWLLYAGLSALPLGQLYTFGEDLEPHPATVLFAAAEIALTWAVFHRESKARAVGGGIAAALGALALPFCLGSRWAALFRGLTQLPGLLTQRLEAAFTISPQPTGTVRDILWLGATLLLLPMLGILAMQAGNRAARLTGDESFLWLGALSLLNAVFGVASALLLLRVEGGGLMYRGNTLPVGFALLFYLYFATGDCPVEEGEEVEPPEPEEESEPEEVEPPEQVPPPTPVPSLRLPEGLRMLQQEEI